MFDFKILITGFALCAAAAPASALQATSVRISSAIPDFLQISEIIATQKETFADVALASAGAIAVASSVGYGGLLRNANDGIVPLDTPKFYHSEGPTDIEYLQVTFARAYDLYSITISGRPGIYNSRDYYDYRLFDGTTLVGSGTIDARNAAYSGTALLAVSAVPEPAGLAMMLGGLGLVAATARRRRSGCGPLQPSTRAGSAGSARQATGGRRTDRMPSP